MRVYVNNAQELPEALERARVFAKGKLLTNRKKLTIEVKDVNRSLEQNARMWAMLADVSKQVDWYGQKLTPEEWKDVFSASLKKQKAVPGLDGGFVILGQRTSKMTVREMADLMTLIEAFGAEQGVRFTCPEEVEA